MREKLRPAWQRVRQGLTEHLVDRIRRRVDRIRRRFLYELNQLRESFDVFRRVAPNVMLIMSGVAVLTVPLVFTLYSPELLPSPRHTDGGLPLRWRVVIGAVWLIPAFMTVLEARARLKQQEGRWGDELANVPVPATVQTLDELLRSGTHGTPPSYRWSVYVFDDDRHLLYPIFPDPTDDESSPYVFKVGQGATGLAWQNRTVVLASGDAVSDATHGLTEAQQNEFRAYRSVVAAPIAAGATTIGVLTGISEIDDPYFTTSAGLRTLRNLADTVGMALVTALPAPEPARSKRSL